MDKPRLERGLRAYLALSGEVVDAVRDGTYKPEDFMRRTARVRSFTDELAKCNDKQLRQLSETMIAVLADLPRVMVPGVEAHIYASSLEFNQLVKEVLQDGV